MPLKHLNQFFFLVVFILLSACGSGGRKQQKAFTEKFQSGQYQEAIAFLQESDFYSDKDNRLLFLMEKGLVEHAAGLYSQSIQTFEMAKKVAQDLFTISLSNKAQGMVLNETFDQFYGASYERSQIYFYQILNHYLLFQQEGSKQELMAARAEVVAWSSFLQTLKQEKLGESVFKDDLLAKIFGALIHEAMGKRADKQIALQLYKDAKELLFKNYNAYQSFNQQAQKFVKDFEKLPKLPKEKVQKDYVISSPLSSDVYQYLDEKIVELTLDIRPHHLKKDVKRFQISKDIVEKIKKARKENLSQVVVTFHHGLIPTKYARKEYYGLETALSANSDSPAAKAWARFGSTILTFFAAEKLGLLPPPGHYTPAGAYLGFNVTRFAVDSLAISFELPFVEASPITERLEVVAFDEKGEEVSSRIFPLINPMGEISRQAILEISAGLYTRLGVRLALKHIAAIAAAYATYKAMRGENRDNDFLARNAALFQYAASARAIAASERADTRYWSTLPLSIRVVDLKLPPGKYRLEVYHLEKKEDQWTRQNPHRLGDLQLEKGKPTYFVNYRAKN